MEVSCSGIDRTWLARARDGRAAPRVAQPTDLRGRLAHPLAEAPGECPHPHRPGERSHAGSVLTPVLRSLRIGFMRSRRLAVPVALIATVALPLSACSDTGAGSGGDGPIPEVYAALYPLEFVAAEVGGDHVSVSPITPAGTDPHDLELSTNTVARLDGSMVVYLSDFQAALDDALDVASPDVTLDVAEPARVTSWGLEAAHGEDEPAHSEDEATHEGGHDHEHSGATDPHFWLDPLRLADVANAVADEYAELDPDNADDYATNAEHLRSELEDLDADLAAGLENCRTHTIVAAHEAYGYLADRYGLEQVGISGLDPESEPSPARLAEIREVVEREGVTTIFAEQLVNPAVAESFASDLGIDVEMLNPLETEPDSGDYLEAMRQNLETLSTALQCS